MSGGTGLTFGGAELFQTEPHQVYALLTDLQRVKDVIPDLVSADVQEPHILQCVVKPGFAFLRGTLRLTIEVEEVVPTEQARMRILAQGIGTTLRLNSAILVTGCEGGSKLTWTAEVVERKGLIAAVSSGLLKAAAEKVIGNAWQQVREKLNEESSRQ